MLIIYIPADDDAATIIQALRDYERLRTREHDDGTPAHSREIVTAPLDALGAILTEAAEFFQSPNRHTTIGR